MEQQSNNLPKKVIITVRVSDVHIERYDCFKPFYEGCYDVYKQLLGRHNDVFSNQFFASFLRTNISVPDAFGRNRYLFENAQRFDWSSIFDNGKFTKWVTNADNRDHFLSALCHTNDSHLIRKHENYEIYVAPILYDNFHADNIPYTEELIKAIKKENDVVYLLLHDNDLYTEGRNSHQVAVSDAGLGIKEKELKDNYPQLFELIQNKKVYVFKHDTAIDDFYRRIVLNLGDGQESKLDGIISLLDNYKNFAFADRLAGLLNKKDIEQSLDQALANDVYDFSYPFLKQ